MPHDHHHHHDHAGHGHHHAPASFGRAFAIGIALNVAFVLVEGAYGLIASSVALLADAGHNLSDVLGLVAAWAATSLASRAPTSRRTYGFKASTILAALANGVLLLVATGAIAWEAVQRLMHPEPVATGLMLWVAVVGLFVNGITALMFMSGRHGDINIRGAFLHMVADAAVTVGVIAAALLIGATGLLWLDPAVSLVIGVVILVGTWGLLRQSVDLALNAVPHDIDPDAVRAWLAGLPGVLEVHDLHVWAIGTTDTALTAHLVRVDAAGDDALLDGVQDEARHRFNIAHTTIQLETPVIANSCALRPEHVV